MNLSALDAAYSGTGSEAYPPRLMLGIVLYEYLKGQLSPAKWFHDQNEGLIALKRLGLGITPSRTAWYDFRDRVGPLLEGRRSKGSGLVVLARMQWGSIPSWPVLLTS